MRGNKETYPLGEREYHLKELAEHHSHAYLGPLLSPLQIRDETVVIDLGCGSGYINAYCATVKTLQNNIGLEFDFATLRLAREANVAQPSIRWLCASAECIPLGAETVDTVVCRVVIPLVDINQVVAEIGRILKPGGMALLALHDWKFYLRWLSFDPRNWKKSAAGLLHFLLGIWFNLTGNLIRPKYKGHRIGQTFQTVFRMRRLLASHGMKIKSVSHKVEFLIYVIKI